jgi:hypothetical protein
MKKNMGSLDKVFRVLIAVTVAVLYYLNIISGSLAYILMVVAIILLITTFINFCPIYSILGINSLKSKK